MAVTYFTIVNQIKEAFLSTGLVRSAYFGPDDYFDTNRAVQFASINISPQPSPIGNKVSTYSFLLEVVDRIDFSEDESREPYGQDNIIDVLATLSRAAEIAFDKLKRGDTYDELVRVVGDSFTAEPLVYSGENYLAGWRIPISFEVPAGGATDGRC